MLVDGHHRFMAWKSLQPSLPEVQRTEDIPVVILPEETTDAECLMISVLLNCKNEATLLMNTAALVKAVADLSAKNINPESIADEIPKIGKGAARKKKVCKFLNDLQPNPKPTGVPIEDDLQPS